jgi:hypothetical protein
LRRVKVIPLKLLLPNAETLATIQEVREGKTTPVTIEELCRNIRPALNQSTLKARRKDKPKTVLWHELSVLQNTYSAFPIRSLPLAYSGNAVKRRKGR